MWTRPGSHPLSLVRVNLTATVSSSPASANMATAGKAPSPPISCGVRRGQLGETGRMSWTDERVDQLKSLWTEGLSASQIARVLGQGITRNAVIVKVHRLGLAGRATPARVDRPRLPSAPRVHLRT